MTDLAKTHPALLDANEGSLNAPRVRVVNQDAGRFLSASDQLFDVIVIDLPDPKGPDLARLYSETFYRSCKRHLSEYGALVTQSSSPLLAPRAFICIQRTMEAAGFSVLPYQNTLPTMGLWGWNLGMKAVAIPTQDLRSRAMDLDFPRSTKFLNREAMAGMLHFWKGMFEGASDVEINREMEPVVDRYYREAEWGM